MIYLIIIVVIAIVFFYIYKSRQNVLTGIDKAHDLINMGAGIYLYSKYKKEYNKEFAAKLGAAVTNELFGYKPSNEIGIKYLEDNKALVQKKFLEIKNDKKLCYYVSIAAHLKANSLANTHRLSGEILLWINKLAEVGILIPIEKIDMPKSNSEFFEISNEFILWVKQTKENNFNDTIL
jgi:hypothetical protein